MRNRPILAACAPDLVSAVCAVAARQLRVPAVDPDLPLARLGLDSLGCIELAAEIESAAGVRVPLDCVSETSTVRSLCEAAARPASGRDESLAIRADAVLPDEVPVQRPRSRVNPAGDLLHAQHILLTGATGFLGREILDRLATRTPAQITCLVRTEGALSPRSDRVATVCGDLSRPRAGLSAVDWSRLNATIDAICHAGASVNWVTRYDALRHVNVAGTRELLRLAAEADASFHFVSSVSVCYSTRGPLTVDEDSDALAAVEGLHFGYAQSKAAAEALVRQAAARGLRARIYRPALLSGHSRTGRFAADDILTRLIAGSVRMRCAPDLDWSLDALPVDEAADLIVRLSGVPAPVLHLVHPRPRHWRECVLWMRVYGYDVRLAPYREWTARVRDEACNRDHPLYPLRAFFLEEREAGLTVPELHEDHRRPHLQARRSAALIAAANLDVTPLDAKLLDTYFGAFVRAGVLPPPGRARLRASVPPEGGSPKSTNSISRLPARGRSSEQLARELLEDADCDTSDLMVTPLGSDASIISELTAWRTGGTSGLFDVRAGGARYVLKVKPHSDEAYEVGAALAGLCGARLEAAYRAYGRGLGLEGGHERELALYAAVDLVPSQHMPRLRALRADPLSGTWALLLDRIGDAVLIDSVDRPQDWTADHVQTAVDGLAAIHASTCTSIGDLQARAWIGVRRTTVTISHMTPLWLALAEHAAPFFTRCGGAGVTEIQRELIHDIPDWRAGLERVPQTLIHNDCNPRNLCIRSARGRPTLCAFDWELATIGAPLRDLAEFLCFVLPPTTGRADLDRLVERHRQMFASRAGVAVDREAWRDAFDAALAELLVDRLSVYALVHRVKPQRFLPRVLRTWVALFALSRPATAMSLES